MATIFFFNYCINVVYNVYTYTNISGNIIKHNLRTSMNERIHFFIKIYISHTLFSMFLWCVRDEWRQGKTVILTQLLLTIAALLPHLGWSRSTNGRWGPQPSVWKLTLILAFQSSTNCRLHLPIFFHNAHLLPLLLPLIYAGASLIDGSVKGQYITLIPPYFSKCPPMNIFLASLSIPLIHTSYK